MFFLKIVFLIIISCNNPITSIFLSLNFINFFSKWIFEWIKKLKEEYFNETIDFVKNIKKNITEQSIDTILSNFDDTIINNQMKKLLKQFIIERRNRIIEIYNLESED
jgi:hypothetical protein